MDTNSRTPRELETREKKREPWRPPSHLPVPRPSKGYRYRWIRVSSFGEGDSKNASARFREGWEPVRAKEHPELQIESDKDSRWPDGVEVGGLLLCKNAEETVQEREDYFRERSAQQLESVDNAYLRTNDPRMPLLKPERRTQTEIGKKPDET